MKSKKLLGEFTKYCEDNPELRFWQALCNWSGHFFVYVAKRPISEGIANSGIRDTFYFEEIDK